jgi:hypothetical protein
VLEARPNRCLLLMSYEDSFYKGFFQFDDYPFFKHIVELLQSCSNRSLAEIGSIDLTHTLSRVFTRGNLFGIRSGEVVFREK